MPATAETERRRGLRHWASGLGKNTDGETTPGAESLAHGGHRQALAWLIFAALLATACAWILTLPVFPSQDGAVHVYYAKVTRDLLAGHTTYAHNFRVARPLPPYSLHAYLLMAFLQWASSETAEKLLACVSVIVCGLGLAWFARRLGRSAALACALAVPFLLNRFLFLGFYGYQIGIGLALVAAALWLRDGRKTSAQLVGFVLLTFLTMFAHPVPYLVLVAFCWSAVGAGWLNRRPGGQGATERANEIANAGGRELIALVLATTFFAYVKHYSHSGALWDNEIFADFHDKLFRILDVFGTTEELPLIVPAYNWVLGAALAVAAFIACWRARAESLGGKITRVQLAVGWALLILIALPFLPRTMNASGFFAERFSILPPLLLFAAVSSWEPGRRARWIGGVTAVAVTVITLLILNSYLAPIARELDVSSVAPGSMRDLHLYTRNDGWTPMEFTFVPYEWSSVRVVDRSGAILSDSPWMSLQIMMLEEIGPKVNLDAEKGPSVVSGTPVRLGMVMAHCGVADRKGTSARIAARHPNTWRLSRYGCFEVLQPVP